MLRTKHEIYKFHPIFPVSEDVHCRYIYKVRPTHTWSERRWVTTPPLSVNRRPPNPIFCPPTVVPLLLVSLSPALPVRSAESSFLLYEGLQPRHRVSPSHTRAHTHTHLCIRSHTDSIQLYHPVDETYIDTPHSPAWGGGCRFGRSETHLVGFLWYRFLLTPRTHNCSQAGIQL